MSHGNAQIVWDWQVLLTITVQAIGSELKARVAGTAEGTACVGTVVLATSIV